MQRKSSKKTFIISRKAFSFSILLGIAAIVWAIIAFRK
jgi:hypothetical protein